MSMKYFPPTGTQLLQRITAEKWCICGVPENIIGIYFLLRQKIFAYGQKDHPRKL